MVRKLRPTTPGQRGMSFAEFGLLTKGAKPSKLLRSSKRRTNGRNVRGVITIRHRGGGHARNYRIMDFNRADKIGIPGKVTTIEYDPNRTAYIMLVTYKDGDKRYHLMPEGMEVGTQIMTAEKTKVKIGNRMLIENIPVGYSIYNIEMKSEKGGQMVRSAGSYAKLVSVEGDYAQIQLPSSEIRMVPKNIYATVGVVSNVDHSNVKIGKAGRTRRMGKRPQVRGKAMNPIDHPHGGGEGSNPIGLKYPKTPWGAHALGKKTRNNKRTQKWILKRRVKKGKK